MISVTQSEKTFNGLLLGGLVLCVGLYVEEAVHFMHSGWKAPTMPSQVAAVSGCRPVPGTTTDFECPVAGYGMARFRLSKDASGTTLVNFIERVQ
jgi:hypothetical protein